MELSDIELLSHLIESGDLTDSQRDAFQGMLARLRAGRVKELTPSQRQWADGLYDKFDLQAEGAKNLISSGQYVPTEEERNKKYDWELMKRPLKPPGR